MGIENRLMGSNLNTEFFDIAANEKSVLAASDFYISFEAGPSQSDKNAQIMDFKSRLRTAIEGMRPQNQEILFAQYAEEGEKNRFFDLENMLFYNLGPSAFAGCAVHGISFSPLSDKALLCRQSGLKNRKHVYSYQCLPLSAIESRFTDLPLMAEWSDIPLDRHEASSPAKYWKAIRGARDNVTAFDYTESPISSRFALKIALYLPGPVRLTNTIKPLIDGVVCAFHGENTGCLACLTDFCMRQHCEELSIPHQFPAVLGEREFIRPYRSGQSFLWNPADDFCKLALVTVSYGAEASSFDGKIYKLPNFKQIC